MNPEVLPDGNQLKCQFRRKLVEKTGSVHKLAKKLDQYSPSTDLKLQPRPKVLGTPEKNTRKIRHLRNMPCVSLLLCLYYTILVIALPFLRQAMLKAPAMILGVKGASKQHCIVGGGGMHEFTVFLRKCPKTFGQKCSSITSLYDAGVEPLYC